MSTSPRNPRPDAFKIAAGRGVIYLLLGLVAATALLPIAYMLAISSGGPEPSAPFMEGGPSETAGRIGQNFGHVLTDDNTDFPLYLRNTLWIALLGVTGTTISSAIVAYGFSRVRWRGQGTAFIVMLSTMMIPFPVVMVPLFTIFREVGWIGTFAPLWVPAWFGSAFSIFLLRQFYMTIPRELDDAARLDGCGHVGILLRILLPLSLPALLVVLAPLPMMSCSARSWVLETSDFGDTDATRSLRHALHHGPRRLHARQHPPQRAALQARGGGPRHQVAGQPQLVARRSAHQRHAC